MDGSCLLYICWRGKKVFTSVVSTEMAETSRRMRKMDLPTSKKWRDAEASPGRIKTWRKEPTKSNPEAERSSSSSSRVSLIRAPVLYYLSLNGQLQHPHFIEVPLYSSQGLYLRDFISQLDQLRGKGMASVYSWSSKRRYKNGFVWHDLGEDDFVYPSHGNEYILKGTELLDPSPRSSLSSYPALSNSRSILASPSPEHSNLHETAGRRNRSLSSIDFHRYRFYRSEWMGESIPTGTAADAWTQTGDWRRLKSHAADPVPEEDTEMMQQQEAEQPERSHLQSSAELSKEDISPPLSDSSRETLESPAKSHRQMILSPGDSGVRPRASSVLMQLLSCGSLPFRDCGPSCSNDGGGTSLIGRSEAKLRRGVVNSEIIKMGMPQDQEASNLAGAKPESKEYFSGSLVEETRRRREVGPSFKRSASQQNSRRSY